PARWLKRRAILPIHRSPLPGLCSLRNLLRGVGLHSGSVLTSRLKSGAVVSVILCRPFPDFLFDGPLAVARIRVIAQQLRRRRAALGFERRKEIRHRLWVVAGFV